jgi:hypothetical protein
MADQHRDYEDYRRGGRREWNDRRTDEWSNWNDDRSSGNQPRRWRSQGDGDSYTDDGYTFAPQESGGYGRGSESTGGRGAFEASGYGRERGGERERSGERGYGAGFGNERAGYPGDRRFFGSRRPEFGGYDRGRGGQEPDRWQSGSEGQSFGGQRPYARDLYSDSGVSRHETDWQSGNAGRGMQSVYTWPGTEAAYGRFPSQEDYRVARGRGGFAGRGPKDYQRSDERIREEICDRMTDDDSLDATDITIQVKQCEVTLAGSVTDREQKRRAEDMAEGVSGVREVTNNIRVARDQNPLDLNQSPSIQVNQPGQQGSRTGTRAGGGSTPSS